MKEKGWPRAKENRVAKSKENRMLVASTHGTHTSRGMVPGTVPCCSNRVVKSKGE